MTPFEKVTSLLDGTPSGNSFKAHCPAHNDRNPSLSLFEDADGNVGFKCHAGCSTDAVLQAIGLRKRDLFARNGRRASKGKKKKPKGKVYPTARKALIALERMMAQQQRITGSHEYHYHDATGERVAMVVRFDLRTPVGQKQVKTFRPASKHADGWRLCDPPGLWPLYRLDKLSGEGRVYVAEGEKCADALAELGLIATTSAHGSNSAAKTDWTHLAGREVVIIPDNDAPGRIYAKDVQRLLAATKETRDAARFFKTPPVTIKVLELRHKGLRDGDDVVDWIDHWQGGPRKNKVWLRRRLERLADEAEVAPKVAEDDPAGAGESDRRAPPDDDRATITITTEEHRVNREAVAALARDTTIYQRGGVLVHIIKDKSPATKGIWRPLTPRIEVLPQPLLRERLAASVRWLRSTNDTTQPAHPPAWCVSAIHARGQWPGIRHLEAVVDYPVLRPDGTILCNRGYDPTTGLLMAAKGKSSPIPGAPNKRDAIAARDALLAVVSDFPFVGECHKSAWLAALLTPLARFAFTGPSPLFLADANVRAAGKGLLLNVIATIVTGERFTVATYTSDEDELRKRITSLALNGDRLVLLDNLAGKFGGAVLDAALTGTSWEDRILGMSRMAKVPLSITWYATGNNVVVGGDTSRRICHVRLESPLERPEERADFQHRDLLTHVRQHRHELLAQAMTILRAYHVAGCPDMELPAWGSFEDWSRLVRNCVVWVGLSDPGETRIILQERADTGLEAMRLLLKHWSEMDKEGKGQTAAEVIRRLYRDTEPWAGKPWFAGLKMAIESVTDSDKATASQLGYKLRAYQRRVLDGKYMDRAGSKSNAIKWAVFDAADLGQVRIGGIVRIPATEVKTKERDHQFAAPPNGRRVDHPNDPKHPHPVGGNRRRLEPSHNGRANR